MTIGPTGQFREGQPIDEHDRGGVFAAMRPTTVLGRRAIELDFGTELNWVAVNPREALILARTYRQKVEQWFGVLSYDASTLPIKVTANQSKRVVESQFPRSMSTLVMNPEGYLGWADHLASAAQQLLEPAE